MTVHLLNAAVMPHEGHYRLKAISPASFSEKVQDAAKQQVLKHYIGYEKTLDVIQELTGLLLGKTNFDQTEMAEGDIFYVARLRRRVSPASKRVATRGEAAPLKVEDFDFFEGKFSYER